MLTQHDDKDLITSAYSRARTRTRRRSGNSIREQTLAGTIQPVLCGSGREHIGIQPLLDAVTLLPAQPARPAAGRRARTRREGQGGEAQARPEGAVLRAGVQGRRRHPNGDLFFVRIYSGTLKAEQPRLQPRQGRQGEHRASSTTSTPTRARAGGSRERPRRRHRRRRRPEGHRSPATPSARRSTRSCWSRSRSPRRWSASRSSRRSSADKDKLGRRARTCCSTRTRRSR